jgi:hypothetical protein
MSELPTAHGDLSFYCDLCKKDVVLKGIAFHCRRCGPCKYHTVRIEVAGSDTRSSPLTWMITHKAPTRRLVLLFNQPRTTENRAALRQELWYPPPLDPRKLSKVGRELLKRLDAIGELIVRPELSSTTMRHYRPSEVETTMCVERPLPSLTEETEWVEIELELHGSDVPFVRGRHYGPPERCSPDEGGYVEDVRAMLGEVEVELSKVEMGRAEERLREQAADDDEARRDAAAEAAYESRMED